MKRDGTQKSRQVVGAGRRRQDPTDYNKKQGELHSPTIDWKTAQTVIAIAAKKGWTVQTTDIASAYLRAPMPDATSKEGKKFRRILEMPENIADMVIRLNKENGYRFFHKDELKKDDRGALYFHIKGALYGTLEAGRQWFETIGKFLEELGMTRTEHDPCLFAKYDDSGVATTLVGVYVDDMIFTSKWPGNWEVFREAVDEHFAQPKGVKANTHRRYQTHRLPRRETHANKRGNLHGPRGGHQQATATTRNPKHPAETPRRRPIRDRINRGTTALE